jgi:pimeloyl-ACP methyl ester carboxylesterase
MEIQSTDIALSDGRTVRVHDTGAGDGLTVLWHHGSPQTGALLDPLVAAAERRGIRLLSYARPSYGGSSPQVGRDVASAASDVRQIVDARGIDRLAVMGASGGGPHALACAALLPGRVVGAVSVAGLAPFTDDDEWFAGMVAPGGLRAAAAGRESRVRFAESAEFDVNSFTELDWAMLGERWSSLAKDAGQASEAGSEGLIDDDLAFVAPWGFDMNQIESSVLLVHGGRDRVAPPAHSARLLRDCRLGELWTRPADGHISILNACALAMDWLLNLP